MIVSVIRGIDVILYATSSCLCILGLLSWHSLWSVFPRMNCLRHHLLLRYAPMSDVFLCFKIMLYVSITNIWYIRYQLVPALR